MSPSDDLIADILRPFECDVGIEPFSDTVPTLEVLREHGIKLGIVSYNWPSIDRQYRELGTQRLLRCVRHIGDSRSPQAIVSDVPENLLFIGDSPKGAIREGMQGAW